MTQLTNYVYCFGELLPKQVQPLLNQQNIMLGARNLSSDFKTHLKNSGYILDDEQTNISHLNEHFGDLTGLYWVWKNSQAEWPGVSHYRRYYDEEKVMERVPFDSNTIYILTPYEWSCSLMSQYIDCHGRYGIDKLLAYAQRADTQLTPDQVYGLDTMFALHPGNMFFCHKTLFDKICSVLFEIMFDIYDANMINYIHEVVQKEQNNYQKRIPAFLAERLLNLMYQHRHYFFGQDIAVCTVGYHQDTPGKGFLMNQQDTLINKEAQSTLLNSHSTVDDSSS